jgi:plasmid segregation protein ParM
METKRFRTRQENKALNNPKGKDYIIGLDIGYSGTKVFFENGYFCFPSYAKRLDKSMMNVANDKDILYRDDDTGELYMVGYNAQDMMESTDTNDTDGELYSRKRYSDKRFRIICNTALGMATLMKKDQRKIVVQTGLPTSYVSGDSPAIKKVLSTPARFSLKIGGSGWVSCAPEVKAEDVHVMAQPSGALYSVLIRNDGSYVQNAKQLLCSNILVLDVGFGTFDFFGIKNRAISCKESTDEIGMRAVLSRTTKKIMDEMNEDIRVAAIQKNLETGTVDCINEETMSSEEKPFGALLESASKEVMREAMEKAKSVTNAFRGYQYIIIDGGTGEAWYDDICKWLSGMKTIKIIPCNFNDHLPFIYSNARGYYMYRLNQKKHG